MNENIIGKEFGILTVISREKDRIYLDGKREEMYRCKCGCKDHKEIVVSRHSLEKGFVTHCGCRMPGKLIDLTGTKFGKLTVIKRVEDSIDTNGRKHPQWECKCDCGNTVVVKGENLKKGHTKSCGCIRKDGVIDERQKTRLYKKWLRLKSTYNICNEWKDYENFKKWAESYGYNEFGEDLQVYTKDRRFPLSPDNCEMLTAKEIKNKNDTNFTITYNGKTQSLTRWAEELAIPASSLARRLESGWDIEKALGTPINQDVKTAFYNGRERSLAELSSISGLSRDVLYDRIIRRHWDVEKAMTTPVISSSSDRAKYQIEHNGDTFSSNQWDHILGYPRCTISERIKSGYTFAEALAGKPNARRKLPKNAIYFVENGKGYSQDEWEEKEKQEGGNK